MNSQEQSVGVKRMLIDLEQKGARAVLVPRQVNVTSLAGVFPASGEMIVVKVSEGGLEVLGRLVVDRPEQQVLTHHPRCERWLGPGLSAVWVSVRTS